MMVIDGLMTQGMVIDGLMMVNGDGDDDDGDDDDDNDDQKSMAFGVTSFKTYPVFFLQGRTRRACDNMGVETGFHGIHHSFAYIYFIYTHMQVYIYIYTYLHTSTNV